MGVAVLPHYRVTSPVASEFANEEDCQKLFASEMPRLFLLALLLTADIDDAEHCVILALRECMSSVSVSREWLSNWARRSVIRNGIKVVAGEDGCSSNGASEQVSAPPMYKPRQFANGEVDDSAGILMLDDIDRLVYVMCNLENYSAQDCALLLGISRREVYAAQNRAVARLAEIDLEFEQSSKLSQRVCAACEQDDFDCQCGHLLE